MVCGMRASRISISLWLRQTSCFIQRISFQLLKAILTTQLFAIDNTIFWQLKLFLMTNFILKISLSYEISTLKNTLAICPHVYKYNHDLSRTKLAIHIVLYYEPIIMYINYIHANLYNYIKVAHNSKKLVYIKNN